MGEELGIDKNTVCRWIRDYRRKNNLPSYAEEKGFKRKAPRSNSDLIFQVKELEKEIKLKNKQIEEERVKVEILKKSLHIFMQPQG